MQERQDFNREMNEVKVPAIVPPDAPLPAEIDEPPPAAPLSPVREPNTDSPPQHV